WTLGSAVANARITPASASASSSAPSTSASRRVPIHARTSNSGRPAVQQRTTSSTVAPTAVRPSGVSQRLSPVTGMNSRPQVRSRISPEGSTNTSTPDTRATRARTSPGQSNRTVVEEDAPAPGTVVEEDAPAPGTVVEEGAPAPGTVVEEGALAPVSKPPRHLIATARM